MDNKLCFASNPFQKTIRNSSKTSFNQYHGIYTLKSCLFWLIFRCEKDLELNTKLNSL